MKQSRCMLVMLVLVAISVSLSSASNDEQQKEQRRPAAGQWGGLRKMMKLPQDLIDFERFQQVFHKHYPSLLEKMARARLFAVNTFRVFVSWVDYIWRRKTKYLIVNMWSDTTAEERRKFFSNDAEAQAPAHFENMAHKLDKVLGPRKGANQNDVIAELDTKGGARKRRSISADEEQTDDPSAEHSMDNPRGHDDGPQQISPNSQPLQEAIASNSEDGLLKSVLKSITKYVPVDRLDPPDGKQWIIHSHPRTGLNDKKDQILFDHNDSGCMGPIRDQGLCGCCYAMATIAMFEYHYCKQTKTPVQFSTQYVIDCGLQERRNAEEPETMLLIGCEGGREDYVASFFKFYGIYTESDYPFKEADGDCPVPSFEVGRQQAKILATDTEWNWLNPETVTNEEIKYHLENKGPLTISVRSYDDFVFYGDGVDMLEQCDPVGGHAMNIVGYGIEDGLEYWLIRNSHSIYWGARGHWKMSTSVRGDCLKRLGFATPKFVLNDDLGSSSSGD